MIETKMTASIPRFLLPQRSSIWISRLSPKSLTIHSIRNVSSKPPKLPTSKSSMKQPARSAGSPTPVLEKPSKFNPPSHPQRLNQKLRQYPGPPMSSAQKEAQANRKYPNMMPPPGTLAHKLLNSPGLHQFIALSVLASVAGWSFYLRYRETQFGDMLPPLSHAISHPITFFKAFAEVIRLEGLRKSEETKERRARKVDDISKRAAYRKAHGLETEGFGGWTALTSEQSLGPALDVGDIQDPKATVVEGVKARPLEEEGQRRRIPVKKWLGIW